MGELFFRAFGACSPPTGTQGLRPGLHSFAASRLGNGGVVPQKSEERVLTQSLKGAYFPGLGGTAEEGGEEVEFVTSAAKQAAETFGWYAQNNHRG